MSYLDDIPFDGDLSEPLPDSLNKRIKPADLSYKDKDKLIESDPIRLESLFYKYISEGNNQNTKSDEEMSLEAELNQVRLEVEIGAIRKRLQAFQDTRDKRDNVYQSINLFVENNLEKTIKIPLKHLANYDDTGHYKRIFSELGDDRLSVSGLIDLIEPCQWLTKDIINFVNHANFRNKFKTQAVKDLHQAVNLLNIRGATILIPKFMIERSIRLHSGYMLPTWKRLLKFQQLMSLNAYLLAKEHKLPNPYKMYLVSSMSMSAEVLLLNMLSTLGKEGQIYARQTATQHKDDFRLRCIDEYEPSSYILENLMTLEPLIKPIVVDAFNFNNISVNHILEGCEGHEREFDIISRARGYTIFKILSSLKIGSKEESIELLRRYNMDNSDLQYLQSVDLNQINIYELIAQLLK